MNVNEFVSIEHAKQRIEAWRQGYNHHRPHSSPTSLIFAPLHRICPYLREDAVAQQAAAGQKDKISDLSVVGVKDRQLVRSDWTPADQTPIQGVVTRQITNVLTNNGYLTEIWRSDWHLDGLPVGQVFQRVLEPAAVSGWHSHLHTSDRLFCASGRLLIALYDARCESPSHGKTALFRIGAERPAIVVVPPGVWHGVRNIGAIPATMLNVVDLAYDYEDPDHYRLPADTPLIPYQI